MKLQDTCLFRRVLRGSVLSGNLRRRRAIGRGTQNLEKRNLGFSLRVDMDIWTQASILQIKNRSDIYRSASSWKCISWPQHISNDLLIAVVALLLCGSTSVFIKSILSITLEPHAWNLRLTRSVKKQMSHSFPIIYHVIVKVKTKKTN